MAAQPNGIQADLEGTRSSARELKKQRYKLYASYALSSWGDRMWAFAVALALALIGENLRLPALSGFVGGVAVLIFGASVGRWIDRMPRLTAATRCLLVNNTAVAVASGLLVAMLYFESQLHNAPVAYYALLSGAVIFTAISQLASSGTKIVITRDWVVVMCRSDKDLLANMNAVMLRIDLTAMIVSPLIAGQLMTSISMAAGCIFISAWNICSYFLENYLLWSIYRGVPDLACKKAVPSSPQKDSPKKMKTANGTTDKASEPLVTQDEALVSSPRKSDESTKVSSEPQSWKPPKCKSKVVNVVTSAVKGWSLYRKQKAFAAGLALGLLYMTVLGLDAITTAFAYEQGLKENILAVVRGVGAIVGISGSFVFPKLRSQLGLPKTGLISLALQLSCLSMAVISIWLPGSPFDLNSYIMGSERTNNCSATAATSILTDFNNTSEEVRTNGDDDSCSVISIWIFLLGVVLARFGLWMADLSISQIYQETVTECNRGVISGVQHSLNQSMDMLKNILVILLPDHRTFGLLIIASFTFVFSGFISFSVYAWRALRHGGEQDVNQYGPKIQINSDTNDVEVPIAPKLVPFSDVGKFSSETALDELAWQEGSLCQFSSLASMHF